ncbi:MAG: amidohydrolase [Candidatus Bathyarchaeota archaeon]
MYADMVLINGKILTMNISKPIAEAIAIKKDKIVEVDSNKKINSLVSKATKIINLNGKTVVPGFIDSHIHVADFGKFLTWINLQNVKSIKELQKKRIPNSKDLDKATSDNPVILYHQYGRVCLVNGKALSLAGITKKTISPDGGKIEKDPETGEPTGVLRETATDLVWKKIPPSSEEEIIEAANLASEKIIESGITSIHWIVTSSDEISIIKRLVSENKLPERVLIIGPTKILEELNNLNSKTSKEPSEKIFSIKVFVDGSLAAHTAALNDPYIDDPGNNGQLFYSQKNLDELVTKAQLSNFSLVIHAMGDKAIKMALKAIEKALKVNSKKNLRYRIEHASVLNQGLIERIKKMGVIVSVQPNCVVSEFSMWDAINRLGPKRARMLYPIKTLISEGIKVIGGSDCPMEPLNPILGIHAAVTRKFFPEEQITVDEALRMYTLNAAYASFEENVKGSIENGKLADLTVLSDDPQTVPVNEIGKISVEMTIIGGKIVYQK